MTSEMDLHTPLRGRPGELHLLRTLLAAVRSDGRGRVVVVRGAPGSGKSRLLLEARSIASEVGIQVLSLGGDPDAHVIPHGPILDGVRKGPTPLLSATVLAQLPIGPEQGYWLRNELEARLQEVALVQPVLVCVDDLQWCDSGTLSMLRTLPPRLATDAVVWVVAVREGEGQPSVVATVQSLSQTGADVVRLGSLNEEAVAEIATDLLGGTPDRSVLASAARAEGQPLLVVELLRGLLDEQLVTLEDGTARLVADELPARLRDAVGRRTARLSNLARDLLQVGAVLGRRFPVDLLAAVLEQPPAALLSPLQEVFDAGLLHDDGELIGFRHDLIREAVTAGMPSGVTRVLGRQAVDVLLARGAPTVEVATMLAETALPGDVQAVAALRGAAKTLALTSSPSAANFSVRALELLPEDSPLRPEVVVESIMLLWQGGRAAAAQELAASMLAGAMGIDSAAEAQIRLGLAKFFTRYSATEAVRQCLTALALPGTPDDLRIGFQIVLAVNYGLSGDPNAVDAVLAPVREMLDTIPDPLLQATLARIDSYAAFHRQDWDLAFRRQDDVIAISPMDDGENPPGVWGAAMWTSIGYPARAFALIDPALASARRDGRVGSLVLWSSMRTRALLDAGRLEEARTEAENVMDIEDIDVVGGLMDNLVIYALVRAALHAGWPDVVRSFRARVLRMTTDETPQVRRQGLWLTALVADSVGDNVAAMAACADAVAAFDQPGPSFGSVDDVADAVVFVRMAMRAGRPDLAGSAVSMAERRAEANPDYPPAAAAASHARALYVEDEGDLREALHLSADSERLLVRASVLEDLGQMVGPDRPREAIALLDEALLLCEKGGAEHDAARVRGRLRKLGVHRRRSLHPPKSKHGLAALTPGEREVVRLVADGGTNRQVAEQLFVSPHTVNTHLRNAFLKLNVRSRVELTRLVTEQNDPLH